MDEQALALKLEIINKIIRKIENRALSWRKSINLKTKNPEMICEFQNGRKRAIIHHNGHKVLSHWRQMHLTIRDGNFACDLPLGPNEKQVLFKFFYRNLEN